MTKSTEYNLWCWILSWFGKRERGTVVLECEEGHQHTIKIWQKPGEDTWEVIQKQVQAEFDKQNTGG